MNQLFEISPQIELTGNPIETIYFYCSNILKNFFFLRFYLFMRDREREAETQADGEAGSMQGAQRGTRSRDLRITPWAEGRR